MKMFECIIDDGEAVYKEILSVKNKKELLEVWGGNGEFKLIKDVTNTYFDCDKDIAIDCLRRALQNAGYGVAEERLICSLLSQHLATIKH